jgi:hypothetical protein
MAVRLAVVVLRDVIKVVWLFNFYLEVGDFFLIGKFACYLGPFQGPQSEVGAALWSVYASHM